MVTPRPMRTGPVAATVRWRGACLAGLLALAALLSACSSGSTSRSAPSSSASPTPGPYDLPACLAAGEGARIHVSNSTGTESDGVILGSGAKGVVLAHQSDDTLCDFLPLGRTLAAAGYQVALYHQTAPAAEIAAWTERLRERGATRIDLIGASIGAMGSLIAAGTIVPPVNGVVSLSAEGALDDVAVAPSVQTLHMPVLFVASEGDPNGGGDVARGFYASCPCTGKQLIVVPGVLHGISLLDGSDSQRITAALMTFLARTSA